LCRQWQIELTGDAALYGDNNLLLPARRATGACMLKLCVPGHDTTAEVTALLAWDGRGRCSCRKPAWEKARSCWNSWTAAGLFRGWACSMRPKSPAI
jgi:hypothetical protein